MRPERKMELAPEPKAEETYYDVLKVPRTATVSEIVAAYHTAKNAFSRESMATYSLFSAEETQAILDRLDEAFHTLANIEKKREYDHILELKAQNIDVPSMADMGMSRRAELRGKKEKDLQKETEFTPLPTDYAGEISGKFLKQLRERRSLSIEDVAKTTKIPLKYITAIESEDVKGLPARVYLQGFVKNLAALYKLDPQLVTKGYLDYTDKHGGSPGTPSL
jgi:curved DNA-binding protein CbpA